MPSPALLLLAACALAAPLHAASIPDAAGKKVPAALPDDIKHVPIDQEIIAPEPAKEIGNELRVKPEDIPVAVVVEDAEPSVKINEVDDKEINRPAPDLRNPGPPQRQEHETQNPERHSDEQLKVSTIKENIEQTQNLLKQSFQDVSDNIHNWFYKNDDQNNIQNNIQSLRETFTNQIQKLNSTIQSLVKPAAAEPVELQGGEIQKNYENIESHLNILKDNFNNDVETLSAGVELVASLRSSADEGDVVKEEAPESPAAPASPVAPAEAAPAVPPNAMAQFINSIRDRLNQGLSTIYTLVGQNSTASSPPAAAGAQADTPAAAAPSPPWGFGQFTLPSWNLTGSPLFGNIGNGFFNNNAGNPLSQLQNPIASFSQFIQNIYPGSSTTKPSEAASSPAAAEPVVTAPEAAADKPADAAAPAQAAQPAASAAEPAQAVGPIRQFLNNIPVVQRIQNSITNRDTPRVPVENSDGQTKGGLFLVKPYGGGSGDNINIDSGVSKQKSEEVKEPVKEESVKEETKKEEEAQVKPESVPEKTE